MSTNTDSKLTMFTPALNRRVVLCVIVDNGGSAAGMAMFGSKDATFRGAVIMDRLWEWGRPVLVREMVDALHDDRALAYTTVMTVMENLYRKGWLRRGPGGRGLRYQPTQTPARLNSGLVRGP